MEASYSIIQKDNEYRILLTSVNVEVSLIPIWLVIWYLE